MPQGTVRSSPAPQRSLLQRGIDHARTGVTLVEVMLAVFVLALLFGAALSSMIQVSRMVATAKHRLRAVAIVNQKMEEMRALTFATLQTNLGDSSFTAGRVPIADVSGQVSQSTFSDSHGKYYRWNRTLVGTGEDVSSTLLKVVVRVEWDDLQKTSAVTAFSYFSQYGVMAPAS